MANIKASQHFLNVVSDLKAKSNKPIRIAEIGIDRGATTKEVIKLLSSGDIYDLYDRDTCKFAVSLEELKAKSNCTVNFYPNSPKLFDSYAWTIAKQLYEIRRSEGDPLIWDAVYLDGAHTFPVDAPTTCCIKEMIRKGGYIVFDDMNWTLAKSPTCNNESHRAIFTTEQMEEAQVRMIVDLLVRSDPRFRELTNYGELRAIFEKIMN